MSMLRGALPEDGALCRRHEGPCTAYMEWTQEPQLQRRLSQSHALERRAILVYGIEYPSGGNTPWANTVGKSVW
jgi:hypothetical protein